MPCVQPARQLSQSRIALPWPSIPTTASWGCSAADAIVRGGARAPPAVPIVAWRESGALATRSLSDHALTKAPARLAASNGLLIVSWSGRSVARPKRAPVPVSVECAIVSIGGEPTLNSAIAPPRPAEAATGPSPVAEISGVRRNGRPRRLTEPHNPCGPISTGTSRAARPRGRAGQGAAQRAPHDNPPPARLASGTARPYHAAARPNEGSSRSRRSG